MSALDADRFPPWPGDGMSVLDAGRFPLDPEEA